MSNEAYYNFVNVRQLENGVQIGSDQAAKLNTLPLGASIVFNPSPEGGLHASVSPTPPHGWRIKWNQIYIYLSHYWPGAKGEPQNNPAQALAMLGGLIKGGFLVATDEAYSQIMSQPGSHFKKLSFWESALHYRPGPNLIEQLDRQPVGAACLASHQGGPDWRVRRLAGDCAGWRVKVGSQYLYVDLDPVDNPAEGKPSKPDSVDRSVELLFGYGGAMMAHEDILEYWSTPLDNDNRTEGYLQPVGRSRYLQALIERFFPATSSALEIGCNLGRNMNHLTTVMGIDTAGMEISARAIQHMKSHFPALSGARTYLGDVVERIKEVPDKSYDLVYSMAVLMHLHPDTPSSFWSDMVRTAGRGIITIENETSGSMRNWPRNYGRLIEAAGARQIHQEPLVPVNDDLIDLKDYQVRIFEV